MKRRHGILLFVFFILVLCVLCSCTPSTPEETTGPEETQALTEPVRSEITLIENGVPLVNLVRKDELDSSDAQVKAALSIRTTLMKYTGKNQVSISTDWSSDGTYDSSSPEILVGRTAYPETGQVLPELKYGDYCVKLEGNKIVVLGYSDAAISYAASRLNELINSAAVAGEDGSYTVTLKAEDLLIQGVRTKTLSELPVFDNGNVVASYASGNDSIELIINSLAKADMASYAAKMEKSGFTEYTNNEIQGNLFYTFYNSSYTVNIGYYDYRGEARIIIEPFSDLTLIGKKEDNVYTQVTTSQISLIGLEYNNGSGNIGNGMSILIRLCDGRFIVIDGGFRRSQHAELLKREIRNQVPAGARNDIKIAAWIITHVHVDHMGMLASYYSSFIGSGISVEKIIVNFMSDSERQASAAAYPSTWDEYSGRQWGEIVTAARALGADLVTTHIGHVFYFADLKIEVLHTVENLAPDPVYELNGSSLVMKMTFTDPKTGSQTTYLSTGDCTGDAFDFIANAYGSYLRSDILQVAHHGVTPWIKESGTIRAYKAAAPATVLWPSSMEVYDQYRTRNWNLPLEDLAQNPNFKECFVAGAEGQVTVLPIPYAVGSAVRRAIP
ncbi:MAG: MBL fold metallo-hydrolase [Clostridia bacterium]|nr:MBL fold metallo-hydrolase [Clostridia bacterium]